MGFGPHKLFVGLLQVRLALRPSQGPITLEFNGLSFLISQGKESLVKENKQATFSIEPKYTVWTPTARSTSHILDKEIDFIPTYFNLKFLAKFGDTTTVDKRFKHLFPKDFRSQQYLLEEAKPKESGSSNL